METVTWLLENGSFATDGILPVVPANTGPNWPSILSGSTSGTHGITNNSFHDVRSPITEAGWAQPSALQAETLPQVAQRYGLRTAVLGGALVNWPPDAAGLTGPVVGWGNWHSQPIVLSNYEIERAELAPYLYLQYRAFEWEPAEILPEGVQTFEPPQRFLLSVDTYEGETFTWELVAIDSVDDNYAAFDRLVIMETGDATEPTVITTLGEGEWAVVEIDLGGRRAGLHLKLLDFDQSLKRVRLYVTAIRSVQAFPAWLEDEMSHELPIPISPSRDALIGGFVDERTFLEETLRGVAWTSEAYQYVVERTQPDILLAWFGESDEMLHRMLGYLDPASPFFDPLLAPGRMDMVRKTYEALDTATGRMWRAMGGPEMATLILMSDHGFASFWKNANVDELLARDGLYDPLDPGASKAVAYSAGAATQVYINLEGRQPGGVVGENDYAALQQHIVDLLESWIDQNGQRVLAEVMTKEQSESIVVDGRAFSMFNASTTGDVVAFAAAPYQFDAATPGQLVTPAVPYFSGQHGYLPDTVPPAPGAIRSLFAAGGPDIRVGAPIPSTAAVIDVAPTIAAILDIPPPGQCDGRVVESILGLAQTVGTSTP